ncbi:glycosyl hydrolase family 18 protein [Paenibacillus cisolokensis]|uniref:glycosyl hydrolase family 18 protein n=1 Tax=Paenibacillus cisolokensis TaxID=1658519 RepID=UPI003D2652DE
MINRTSRMAIVLLIAVQTVWATAAVGFAAEKEAASAYRVYQNDKPLREFVSESQAIAYAKRFKYAHVEKITGRVWVWDNFPKFKVYQGSTSYNWWEYDTYEQALAKAKTLKNVHIRDLEKPGWVYSNYAKYQLYQGDKTKAEWGFETLEEAKKEAKRWGNAHIMDIGANKWVWDNLSANDRLKQRQGTKKYAVYKDGEAVSTTKYGFLLDAINASAKVPGSTVVNTVTKAVVHTNVPSYEVFQNGKPLKSFFGLHQAVQYAKSYAGSRVALGGETYWTNEPYLTVYQGDNKIKSFHTRKAAVAYAAALSGSVVRTEDGRAVWSNTKQLVYLGWNGTSNSAVIREQVAVTQGLDIDSPTWFELADAGGTLKDNSDPALARELKAAGISVMPLVHNQFDQAMTTAFLADTEARKRFIAALVNRLAELKVDGVNLDFESLAGTDRDAYTSFVRELTNAAHAKKLKVSIDLPRGDTAWNHLTGYDHKALAGIVDTVIVMAYDEHWQGGPEAGSVSGLAWTEEGIKQYLSYGIPRSKLMLGIPFYVREWQLDADGKPVASRAVYMKEVPKLIAERGAKGTLDRESGQMKYTYQKDGSTYVFWAETEQTVKQRIELAKTYDLAGIAAWRLGYESADLWTTLLRLK